MPCSGLGKPSWEPWGVIVRSSREDCGDMVRFVVLFCFAFFFSFLFSLEKSLWLPRLKITARTEISKGKLARSLFPLWGDITRLPCRQKSTNRKGVKGKKNPTSVVEILGFRAGPGLGTERLVCP